MKKGVVKFTFLGIGLFILLFLILFIPEGKSWAGTGAGSYNCSGCDDCTAAIGNASAGATIYLNTSLAYINQTCINFGNKSNVIFDCQNYSNYIQGNGSMTPYYYGVNMSSIRNDAIRNCNVSKFYNAFYLFSSSNNTLTSNTGTSNSSYGFFLRLSSNNTLTSNTGISNTGYGFYLYYSSNNNTLISNIGISNSSYGFFCNFLQITP